jgi:IS5 family transposase
MKQMSFADAEYAGKRKQTRRERFLIEMDQVVSWKGLIALIEPHYLAVRRIVDSDAACASDAELVRLQRSGDGRHCMKRPSCASSLGCIWIEFPMKRRFSSYGACWKNMSWRAGFCRSSMAIWVIVV